MKSINICNARDWLEMHYYGPPLGNLADAIGVSRVTLWRYRNKSGLLSQKHGKRFIEAYPEYEA